MIIITLNCNRVDKFKTERKSPEAKFLCSKWQSIQNINKEYNYYGKEYLNDLQDTATAYNLIQIINPLDDTIYISMLGLTAVADYDYYKVENGEQRFIVKDDADYWNREYLLKPNQSEIFLTNFIFPIELDFDEINFSFLYTNGDTLNPYDLRYIDVSPNVKIENLMINVN